MIEDREEDALRFDSDSDVHYSEAQLQHQMDKVVLKESVHPNIVLDNLRFKPHSKSKLYIPLCRMRPLEAVHPRLKHDVAGLGAHSKRGVYGWPWNILCVARGSSKEDIRDL